MSALKQYKDQNVLDAARERISKTFDSFEKIYISFSGGKDSTTMLHLVMEEATRRQRKVGVLVIDLEAQYTATIDHVQLCIDKYRDLFEVYWVCLPMSLRNAVSNFEPRWICWEPGREKDWVRQLPKGKGVVSKHDYFPFFQVGMEFEEFMVLFGQWYAGESKALTAAFVGIRTDESLNRFRTIASRTKKTFEGHQWTTKVVPDENLYNVYPIYDWAVSDLWHWHYLNPTEPYYIIYDYMYRAGLTPSQMRLCQPYGDDQRRGLWLYHILEPQTWFKVVSRVNGVNSGSLYIKETGNINGYNKITKPENHTWESYCTLLLNTLPTNTSAHYKKRFRVFIKWWTSRGYADGIPDESPATLENKKLAPSWRRLCKVLLRNDYWCKGLAFTQPKSEAYAKYREIKGKKVYDKPFRKPKDEIPVEE